MAVTSRGSWMGLQERNSRSFTCSNCGSFVASSLGYEFIDPQTPAHIREDIGIYICTHCSYPVFFDLYEIQYPGTPIGHEVKYLSEDLKRTYDEIRDCYSINAFTSAVLLCRKMLMNVSVKEGADEGLKFIEYIDYLAEHGLITQKNKRWVDQIRTSGNEATHNIEPKSEEEARTIITFVEMILRTNYEYTHEFEEIKGKK